MTDFFHNGDYKVCPQAENKCFSVRGNHAWAGEGLSFFIPAAKLKIGRIFSILGSLARRAMSKFRQVCWRQEQRSGHFVLPGAAGAGRLVSRRL